MYGAADSVHATEHLSIVIVRPLAPVSSSEDVAADEVRATEFAAMSIEPVFVSGWQIGRPKNSFSERRAAHIRSLEEQGGRHLIFVRYQVNHVPGDEWVYNAADIDGSSIVWAHDLGQEKNRELVAYYAGRGDQRQVWLLDADVTQAELKNLAVPN